MTSASRRKVPMASRTSSIPARWKAATRPPPSRPWPSGCRKSSATAACACASARWPSPPGRRCSTGSRPPTSRSTPPRSPVAMARAPSAATRKVVGLGFLPEEARHGFLIDIPKGNASSEIICITEHRGDDLDHLGARTVAMPCRSTIRRCASSSTAAAGWRWRRPSGKKPTAGCAPTACRWPSS